MKILMLTPYLPYPPSSGGQIRSYNLIKQLSKKHEITLCSLIKYQTDGKYIENLKGFCNKIFVFNRPEKPWTLSNITKTAFSLFPFLVIRNFSNDEKTALVKIINEGDFDIIHAETFYVSPHIPKTSIPIVLVDQTIESQVYKHFVESFPILPLRPILFIDVLKIRFWEKYYWKKASRVVAVSETDAFIMRKLVPELKVEVVPNGVGEDLISNIPLHLCNKILFIGNYAWLQNIEAARILAKEVFPKILKLLPECELVLAGQNTEKIMELKSENITLNDLAVDDIEGVKKAFATSGVLIAPLYGPGGTRLKILGAMAAKLPVITTQIGISGIDAVNGESFLKGNTTQDLADLAVKILTDKDLYGTIAINARKLVDEKYSYDSIAEKLSKIYEEVASQKNV